MSFHTNYEKWIRMTDPRNCPVCKQAPMPEGMEDIAEFTNREGEFETFVANMRKRLAKASR